MLSIIPDIAPVKQRRKLYPPLLHSSELEKAVPHLWQYLKWHKSRDKTGIVPSAALLLCFPTIKINLYRLSWVTITIHVFAFQVISKDLLIGDQQKKPGNTFKSFTRKPGAPFLLTQTSSHGKALQDLPVPDVRSFSSKCSTPAVAITILARSQPAPELTKFPYTTTSAHSSDTEQKAQTPPSQAKFTLQANKTKHLLTNWPNIL